MNANLIELNKMAYYLERKYSDVRFPLNGHEVVMTGPTFPRTIFHISYFLFDHCPELDSEYDFIDKYKNRLQWSDYFSYKACSEGFLKRYKLYIPRTFFQSKEIRLYDTRTEYVAYWTK